MSRDKKVSGGRITFVLARGLGDAYLDVAVELDEVRALLTAALNDADQLARENDSVAIISRATLGGGTRHRLPAPIARPATAGLLRTWAFPWSHTQDRQSPSLNSS